MHTARGGGFADCPGIVFGITAPRYRRALALG